MTSSVCLEAKQWLRSKRIFASLSTQNFSKSPESPQLLISARHFIGLKNYIYFFSFSFNFFFIFIYLFIYFTILYWFCHTFTWIRHGCTCVPHPELPSHLKKLHIFIYIRNTHTLLYTHKWGKMNHWCNQKILSYLCVTDLISWLLVMNETDNHVQIMGQVLHWWLRWLKWSSLLCQNLVLWWMLTWQPVYQT